MCPGSVCVQYAKPWLHSDIKSCCRQSAYVFTSMYDSTLLGRMFFTPKVFLHEINITDFSTNTDTDIILVILILLPISDIIDMQYRY